MNNSNYAPTVQFDALRQPSRAASTASQSSMTSVCLKWNGRLLPIPLHRSLALRLVVELEAAGLVSETSRAVGWKMPNTLDSADAGYTTAAFGRSTGNVIYQPRPTSKRMGSRSTFSKKGNSHVTMNFGKSTIVSMIALTLAMTLGCSADSDKNESTAANAAAPSAGAFDASNPGQVDEAIMAQIIPGIEAGFSDRNATGRWEGTVMHVKMTGDATTTMAGFTECRVLVHLLKEGQTAVVEFPNGSVQCAEVLKDD